MGGQLQLSGASFRKKAAKKREREWKLLQENNRLDNNSIYFTTAGKSEHYSHDGGECSKVRRLHSPDTNVDFPNECVNTEPVQETVKTVIPGNAPFY